MFERKKKWINRIVFSHLHLRASVPSLPNKDEIKEVIQQCPKELKNVSLLKVVNQGDLFAAS